MTKAEFFAELKQAIAHLPGDTRDDTLRYFTEQFEDLTEEGMTEDEAAEALSDFRETVSALQEESAAHRDRHTTETADRTEHRTFTAEHLPPRIQLTEKNCGVELLPSPDGRLRVEYAVSRFTEISVSCDTDCFTYTAREIPHFVRIQFLSRKPTRLYLPQGYLPHLEIITGNAPIRVADISCATGLIKTSNSPISLAHITAEELTAKTANSSLKAEHISAEKLTAKTANSPLKAAHITAKEMRLGTSNASLTAEHITVPDITLTTSNGKISLQNADVHHVTLSTVNAGIDATLPGTGGDYGITAVTSTAIRSDKAVNSPRSLNAKTFNGKVNITFTGEY